MSTWLQKTYQNQVLEAPWSLLEPSWGLLAPSWRHLEASWGRLGASWTYLGASWPLLEASWGVLEASWGVLELSWEVWSCARVYTRVHACARWRGRRGLLLGSFRNFPSIIRILRKETGLRILLRVWDSVRHAQAQGLARRIQSAAELRTRHRRRIQPEPTRSMDF